MWPWWAWLLSALGILVTTVGVGVAVTKAWAVHDWKTCQCVDCRKRRYHWHKGKGHHVSGVGGNGDLVWTPHVPSPKTKLHWKSTAQLEQGMVVLLRQVPHRVGHVRSDRKGYLVPLTPMGGPDRGKTIIATVAWANGNRKYWEVR